jgi:hypothetical protein
VAAWLPAARLLVGYVTLGVLLAVVPERTRAAQAD